MNRPMGLLTDGPILRKPRYAISRDIDLKLIQDTYRVVINSTKQINQTDMWGGGGAKKLPSLIALLVMKWVSFIQMCHKTKIIHKTTPVWGP